MEKPTFGLADLPDHWEIRLHEQLILQLDKLNRPWAHDGSGRLRGDTVYWYRSTLRQRSKDRMTQEELDYYYASYRFSERLWGTSHRKDKKYGDFIRKDMIPTLRMGVHITDSELERAITGIKVGPGTDRILSCDRLPIKANKYWAWFIGLYYASGVLRFRDPKTSKRAKRESVEMYFKLHNPVIELGKEYADKIGVYFREFDRAGDRKVKHGKTKGMRTGRLRRVGFGWPEYKVLEKFGMSTEWKKDKTEVNITSRFWKRKVPDWIRADSECMAMFVEGMMNGGIGVSAISFVRKRYLSVGIYLRINGLPDEYVKQFAMEIHDWFEEQDVKAGFRKFGSGYAYARGKVCYEVGLGSWNALWFILSKMNIARPDLRARLLARIKASEDSVFREAMLQLRSPHNIVLTMLTEVSMTADELDWSLQIKKEGIRDILRSLQMRGMIKKRRDRYIYDLSRFEKKDLKRKEERIETLSKRALRYSTRLLYRCTKCKRVYVIERETCGMCQDSVEPIARTKVMQGIHQQRNHAIRRLRKLKVKENEKKTETDRTNS